MSLRNSERVGCISGGTLVASTIAMLEQKRISTTTPSSSSSSSSASALSSPTVTAPRRFPRSSFLSSQTTKLSTTSNSDMNTSSHNNVTLNSTKSPPDISKNHQVSTSSTRTSDSPDILPKSSTNNTSRSSYSCTIIDTIPKVVQTTPRDNSPTANNTALDHKNLSNSSSMSMSLDDDKLILHVDENNFMSTDSTNSTSETICSPSSINYTTPRNYNNSNDMIVSNKRTTINMATNQHNDGSRPLSASSEDSTAGSEQAIVDVCGDDDDDSSDDTSSSSSSTETDDCMSSDESSSGREFILMDSNSMNVAATAAASSSCYTNSSNNGRGLDTIAEEERPITGSSVHSVEEEEDDSTCCDEDFQWISNSQRESPSNIKLPSTPSQSYNQHIVENTIVVSSTSHHDSILRHPSSSSSSSSYHQNISTKPPATAPRTTITHQRTRSDSSPKRSTINDKPSAPGSLDRRRLHQPNRHDRDTKSKSAHTLKDYHQRSPTFIDSNIHREFHFPPPPPRCELYSTCTARHCSYCDDHYENNCTNDNINSVTSPTKYHNHEQPVPQQSHWNDYECFHKHHERNDPKRYGSSSLLVDHSHSTSRATDPYRLGSQPELYVPELDRRPVAHTWRCLPHSRLMERGDICCAYHTLPPWSCCHHGGCMYESDVRNYNSWNYYNKPAEQEDKIKRLENEKESLQMQVSVLSEQIEAQSEKITELEKLLNEKKQLLGNAEDLLQREMLSRSSLETQKLELMSAMSELKLQQAALERENIELRTSHFATMNGNHVTLTNVKKPPLIPRSSPVPQLTSTPVHPSNNQLSTSTVSPSPSPISAISAGGPSPNRNEETQPKTPPPNYRRTVDLHYGSLPRQTYTLSNGLIDNNMNCSQTNLTGVPNSASVPARKGVAFGKGISSLLGGARGRGHSVPNLAATGLPKLITDVGAETEKVVIEDTTDGNACSPQTSPLLQTNKNKGIKKIFGKMKRSGSGNLEDLPGDGEFRRGGVRATAGPRLCMNQSHEIKRPDKPFNEWDTDNICDWFQELGLEAYITDAKRWVKDGAHLQSASVHDLEKELGMKNALHRKKLQLAILDMTDNGTSDTQLALAGRLDTSWVLRWLDDTGLPQHKETFSQARIDGRLLHRLTIDDLAALHVTSLLHATSIRRGIQVLREHNFEPGCLIRRSLPDEHSQPEPKEIALWTAHRVMEWLRVVDLAEYAPNLRGAGVHGALMVYEPKFTAELMATLLNIPPSKTLLRRHLSTHFKELLGRDVIQEKREAEATLGYVPLTPSTKLKVVKKSQFSLKRKKSKGELDYGDLVCPLKSEHSTQSGENTANNNDSATHGDASSGTMKRITGEKDMAVYHLANDGGADDVFHTHKSSPLPQRLKDSILV